MSESTSVSFFTSIEELVRAKVRDFVEAVAEDELTMILDRAPYERGGSGYRNGRRTRTVTTSIGTFELSMPRARVWTPEGEREFRPSVLPLSKRRLSERAVELIIATYLCGVSCRKSRVALAQALGHNVSKSTVSRCLALLRPEWEAWQKRDLSETPVLRLILDGFCVSARMGGKALRISVLAAMGVLADGSKVLLALKGMGGESKEAWRELLDDLAARGMPVPSVCIIDGSKGLRAALSELWPATLVQRCTVHKERNLLGYTPEPLHEELKADYSRMMYAPTAEDAVQERSAFLAKWSAKCPKAAKSFEEAGDELFTFLKFPPAQWKSLRTTNCIERLNEEFRRRVKVQGVQPSADSVCMLFWALLASGAVFLHKVHGWETLSEPPREVHLAA